MAAKIKNAIKRRRAEANGAVFAACGPGKSRVANYLEIRAAHPSWTDADCKRAAGYAPDHTVKAAKPFIQDMLQRIEAAQQKVGFYVEDSLLRLKGIRDNGEDKDSITAIKVAHEITGERMPERIDMNVKADDDLLRAIIDSKDS